MRGLMTTKYDRKPLFDLFDEFDKALQQDLYPATKSWGDNWKENWFKPAAEFKELENAYAVHVEVPGVKKEDLKIDLNERNLKVWGEKKFTEIKEVKGKTYTERTYGKFERVFTLPESGDLDKVVANYNDGVLEILIPKAEKAKARTISIK